jgi:hypothetical protein
MAAYRRGLSDYAVADAVGMHQSAVLRWRRRNGLEPNGMTDHTRRKMRANMRRLDAEAGLPLGLRWRMDDRLRGRDVHGWTVPLARHERDVCACLLSGPKDSAELAAQSGKRYGTIRNLMWKLKRRKLVVRTGTAVPGRMAVWALAPGVERRESA